ncbi:hypothetical protein C1H46_042729 [Malus baccata]|uniref:HR-like lesion-inducer n=1 Tax=Malus baccata TaxID=106549 RepID=A0A540KBY8_MALBA|nr:hypothetical protein C1H46_042729 [Malus baccata]
MGFVSFLGRVLFASIFILSAWQAFNEFGVDGGPAAKDLAPKFNVFKKNLSSKLGVAIPEIEVRHLAAGVVAMKGLGGLLFVLNSSFGASLLLLQLAITTPLIYDFYNYSPENAKFGILLNEFLQVSVPQGEQFRRSCHLVKTEDNIFSVPQGEELRRSCHFVKTKGIHFV